MARSGQAIRFNRRACGVADFHCCPSREEFFFVTLSNSF